MDMTNSLFIYKALTQIGVQPDMAHRVEKEIQHGLVVAHDEAFERKVDHLVQREALSQKMGVLVTRDEFNQKIAGLISREEFHQQIGALRTEVYQEFAKLRAEVHHLLQTMIWKSVGLNFAFFSVAIALLKYAS